MCEQSTNTKKIHLDELHIDRHFEEESNQWSKVLILLVAMLCCAGFLSISSLFSSEKNNTTPVAEISILKSSAPDVSQSHVESVPITRQVLNATGYIVARRLATVSSKVTGKITKLNVEEGTEVQEDQILAQLESDIASTNLLRSKAQLRARQASHAEVKARLKEARLALARTQSLFDNNLVSQSDLDKKKATVESLNARLTTRGAEIKVAEQELELQRQNLEELTIRAPFSGVVIAKNAHIGEIVSPVSSGGFTRTGIFTLVDMNSLEIQVDVNESYLNRIHPSQVVEASLHAYPDWIIPAEVVAIVPTANRQKATVKVRIKLLETDKRILPDMGIRVSFLEKDYRP